MNKRTKILLIILSITIIITISLVMLVLFSNKNIDNNNKQQETNKKYSIEEQIKELYDNSYKYYQLKEGQLELTKNTIEIEGQTYTEIRTPKFTSFEEISSLIEDNFLEEFFDEMHKAIFDKHEFIELNDRIYVKLSEDTCKLDYELNINDMTYKKISDEKIIIYIGERAYYAYYENDKLKLRKPFHVCEKINTDDELETE